MTEQGAKGARQSIAKYIHKIQRMVNANYKQPLSKYRYITAHISNRIYNVSSNVYVNRMQALWR